MNNTLSRKIQKVLEIKLDQSSEELIGSLDELSSFYQLNSIAARRNLRNDIERRYLEINNQFLDQFTLLYNCVEELVDNYKEIEKSCNDVCSHFDQTNQSYSSILVDAKRMFDDLKETEEKEKFLDTFISRFRLTEEEELSLQRKDIDMSFFATLARLSDIHRECKSILSNTYQRPTYEIMEMIAQHQEKAYPSEHELLSTLLAKIKITIPIKSQIRSSASRDDIIDFSDQSTSIDSTTNTSGGGDNNNNTPGGSVQQQNFYTQIKDHFEKIHKSPSAPSIDLSPTIEIKESINKLKELLTTYSSSLVPDDEKEDEFKPVLTAMVDPILEIVKEDTYKIDSIFNNNKRKEMCGSGSRFVSAPSASFIRADRSNRSAVQNSFLTNHSSPNQQHQQQQHNFLTSSNSSNNNTSPAAATSSTPSTTTTSGQQQQQQQSQSTHTQTHSPIILASPLISSSSPSSSPSSSSTNVTAASTNMVQPTTSIANGASPSSSMINSSSSASASASTTPSLTHSQSQSQLPTPTTIDSIFSALHDLSLKKKALFDLKDLLKDESNVKRFIEKDGIRAIEDQMTELSGNTLAYALIAIQAACSYEIGVHALPSTLIHRILAMIADSTAIPSITKTGLSILSQYCQTIPLAATQLNNQYGKAALASQHPSLLANIVALLSSSTVDIQLNALTLLNIMLSKSNNELQSLINKLDEYDINIKLKKLFESNVSQELKKQLYYYQKHKLSLLKKRKNIAYNKELEEHETLLLKLWTTTYPDVKLETRVSEQWKLLGFQGTDPATDFRGMGIFGLENLLYIAENHTDQFRKLISSQIDRKERDYPVAVAGINLTQMFFELFKVTEENNPEFPIFPILFSHKNAFEEVYCIAFQLLDITWDTMNASYMEFPKVIATVKQSIVTALETKPTTLEAFNWAAGASKKSNTFQNEDESLESEDIKKLKNIIKTDIMEVLKTQKLNILADGIYFKLQKPVKAKTVTHTHLYVCQTAVSQVNGELLYAQCTEPSSSLSPPASSAASQLQQLSLQPPMSPGGGSGARGELTGSGGLLDKTSMGANSSSNPAMPSSPTLTGSGSINNPNSSGGSSASGGVGGGGLSSSNDPRAAMSFSSVKINDIHFPAQSDAQQRRKPDTKNTQQQQQQHFFTVNLGREIVELIASTREDHSNFVDAIRLLNNKQIDCPETIEEYKILVNLSMKLKLLDLEGVELPKSAPKVPPPPPDFAFLSKDSLSSPNNSFIAFNKS
ncbi:engulfment and cell motility ELM family protein [Heterostelium album PN500]|uniref:Conserved oligomeric Golgi complex subunit 6 n=1 Tax=Heterostelium pallidum (strain ATCC 26659 / Pp 5 / PN500) TaxID=670386 RepID=D3AWE4_HETP5|nr:engulfment and cell motility ELM family protein [Heterostelium album PN500]EFA86617.1 engulfment and cell motility ELM family protein [Heterostelium album PN500]|eukprot:XP_020438722.1 engulfment and cell motility ELM family protein [Heterostelium album PN500]